MESASIFESLFEAFQITPELTSASRIEESIAKINQQQDDILDRHTQSILALQKEHQSILNEIKSLTDPKSTSPEILHQLDVTGSSANEDLFKLFEKKSSQLDDSKVLLAKRLNDLESQINTMKIMITRLNESLDRLNTKSENLLNENLLQNPDSKIMKINLYKSLGLLIESVNEQENDKILIYNKENDLTNILNVNDKYSDYFITNHIWDKL